MKGAQSSEGGFTLIELTITLTVVAIAIVAIAEIFISVGRLNRQAHNYAIATQLAQQKMEANRNLSFNAIPASENFTSSLPSTFGSPKSAVATFSDLSPAQTGLKQFNVTIYYSESGVRKDVQISTLITQRGINR